MGRILLAWTFLAISACPLGAEVVWHVRSSSTAPVDRLPPPPPPSPSPSLSPPLPSPIPPSQARWILPRFGVEPTPTAAKIEVGEQRSKGMEGVAPSAGSPTGLPWYAYALALPLLCLGAWRWWERRRFMADMARVEEELLFREERGRI